MYFSKIFNVSESSKGNGRVRTMMGCKRSSDVRCGLSLMVTPSSENRIVVMNQREWFYPLSMAANPARTFDLFLIQTNRIARILAGSKKKICTKKPRFMSACAQLVIAFLLIMLQLGIIVALLIIEPPQVCALSSQSALSLVSGRRYRQFLFR